MRLLTVRQPIIRAGRREGGGRERKRGRGRGGGKEIYREAFKENGMRGRMDRGGGGGGHQREGKEGWGKIMLMYCMWKMLHLFIAVCLLCTCITQRC